VRREDEDRARERLNELTSSAEGPPP